MEDSPIPEIDVCDLLGFKFSWLAKREVMKLSWEAESKIARQGINGFGGGLGK